jgi:hypothetical protein
VVPVSELLYLCAGLAGDGLLKRLQIRAHVVPVPVSELLDLCAVLAGDWLGEGVLVKLLHVLGQVVLGLFNGQRGHNDYVPEAHIM